LRSSVIDIEAAMASIFLVVSAGMMPSQAVATSFALQLACFAERVGDLDFPADPLARCILRGEGRIGFGGDRNLDGLGRCCAGGKRQQRAGAAK
jgi:hypothetical protein